MREQREPFVPMAFLQSCCDLHRQSVSSVTVKALALLTGSRRPNGLSGGSRNEGIVLLFELASQACGEGLGSKQWGIALRSVRVLNREKGSTVVEHGVSGEESIMVKQKVGPF